MVESWIHVRSPRGPGWVFPIWTSYRNARDRGSLPEIPSELSELALHIETRTFLLPTVMRTLDEAVERIYAVALDAGPQYVSRDGAPGHALEVSDSAIAELLLRLNSAMFEIKACLEHLQEFYAHIHKLGGDEIAGKNALRKRFESALDAHGCDTAWLKQLADNRNLFLHESTPFIAVGMTDPQAPSLLIMKRNLSDFSDPREFLTMSDLNEMAQGISQCLRCLQEHLLQFIEGLPSTN